VKAYCEDVGLRSCTVEFAIVGLVVFRSECRDIGLQIPRVEVLFLAVRVRACGIEQLETLLGEAKVVC
jgi:hypothetical protein